MCEPSKAARFGIITCLIGKQIFTFLSFIFFVIDYISY